MSVGDIPTLLKISTHNTDDHKLFPSRYHYDPKPSVVGKISEIVRNSMEKAYRMQRNDPCILKYKIVRSI